MTNDMVGGKEEGEEKAVDCCSGVWHFKYGFLNLAEKWILRILADLNPITR